MDTVATEYSAWNPGLESELPRDYLPLATIFRPENVSTEHRQSVSSSATIAACRRMSWSRSAPSA